MRQALARFMRCHAVKSKTRDRRRSEPMPFREEQDHMDVLYLGLTIGFVALSLAFIVACERLS